MVNPINKLRNKGINTNAKGIRVLKLSSNVREFVIQDKLLKKNPNPKTNPNINKFFYKVFFGKLL